MLDNLGERVIIKELHYTKDGIPVLTSIGNIEYIFRFGDYFSINSPLIGRLIVNKRNLTSCSDTSCDICKYRFICWTSWT